MLPVPAHAARKAESTTSVTVFTCRYFMVSPWLFDKWIRRYYISRIDHANSFFSALSTHRSSIAPRCNKAPNLLEALSAIKKAAAAAFLLIPENVCYFTRARYSSVRVSISILSPISTKAGTGSSNPVVMRAGFITFPEVSPLTAGSV